MKRILLEILAGMAVIVLMASLHHQITRLKAENGDVATLRQLVHDAVEKTDTETEQSVARQQALAQIRSRIEQMESRISEASLSVEEAEKLREELLATRRATDRFKHEIARDVTRTQELVDAYHRESRARDQKAAQQRSAAVTDIRSLADRFLPDPGILDDAMLKPTVQLNGDDTVGSGTLIFSGDNIETDTVESYVLTSYHVIRNILADTRSARRDGISVTIYLKSGPVEDRADMVSHDERIDAALLKMRSAKKYQGVARAVSRTASHRVRVWDRIYAVGCPLGNDPIPTRGEISSVQNELNGANYWMINAPTYFGNSGGGVFLADSRELVGVFSKIYTHGRGNPVVVPHMGLCTPIELIYDWLEKDKLDFVLESGEAASTEFAATPSK